MYYIIRVYVYACLHSCVCICMPSQRSDLLISLAKDKAQSTCTIHKPLFTYPYLHTHACIRRAKTRASGKRLRGLLERHRHGGIHRHAHVGDVWLLHGGRRRAEVHRVGVEMLPAIIVGNLHLCCHGRGRVLRHHGPLEHLAPRSNGWCGRYDKLSVD